MAMQDYEFQGQGWESPRSVFVTHGCQEFSSSDGSDSHHSGNNNSVLTLLPVPGTMFLSTAKVLILTLISTLGYGRHSGGKNDTCKASVGTFHSAYAEVIQSGVVEYSMYITVSYLTQHMCYLP